MDDSQKDSLRKSVRQKTPYYPFDSIESKINFLQADISAINKHSEEFNPNLIRKIEELGAKIGDHLIFYLIQEIQDFYRQAYKKFGKNISFPESAEIIRPLRDRAVAHMNAEDTSEIAELCIKLEERYGIPGKPASEFILEEWRNFKEQLYAKIKSGELSLESQIKIRTEIELKSLLEDFSYQVGMMRRCFYRYIESSFYFEGKGGDEDFMVAFLTHIRALYYFFLGSNHKDEVYAGDYVEWNESNSEMDSWREQINVFLLHLDYKRNEREKYKPYEILNLYTTFRGYIIKFIDKISKTEYITPKLKELGDSLKREVNSNPT